MRVMELTEGLEFRENKPNSQPLYVDANGRILRFALRPGQSIDEHSAPNSPFYVTVLQGKGIFTGGDGQEREVGPNTLLVFDPAERHSVRAVDEDLVFIGFLHGVGSARPDKVGGLLGQESNKS